MKYSISTLAILLFFVSCTDNSKSETAVFKATTKSLEQSSNAFSDMTADYRKKLFDRLHDIRTSELAKYLQPKAVRISELTVSAINYINTLRSQLKEESGNFQVVNKVFFQQKKGTELYRHLRNFIDTIYTIEPKFDNRFPELRDKFNYLDTSQYNDKKFAEAYFRKISGAAALSMLAKIENDILHTENRIITYCYYQIDSRGCEMDYFYPLINISSVHVKAGDSLEITGGVGSFSVSAQPKFTIEGNKFFTDESGIVTYNFKAPLTAGTYTKTVKMEYTKPDGTGESFTKNIKYTVIEEK